MKPRRSRRRKASNHSIMVTDRRRFVTSLAAALATQGGKVATDLAARLTAVLAEGEEMPDLGLLLRLLERLARKSEGELEEADARRWLAGMGLKALRRAREEPKRELYAAAVEVRRILVETYGAAHCRLQFGLGDRTPRNPGPLAVYARRLVARLTDPGLRLPEPLLQGVAVDPGTWAERLRPSLQRLELLSAEIERRRVLAGDEVISRQQALAACDATVLPVARAAEALFALAGHRELARRLRPAGHDRIRDRFTDSSVAAGPRWRAMMARMLTGLRKIEMRWQTALRRLAERCRAARKA